LLRQQARRFVLIQILIDILCIVLAFFLSFSLREANLFTSFSSVASDISPIEVYLWIPLIHTPLLLIILRTNGAYNPRETLSAFDLVWVIFKSIVLSMLALGTILYFMKYQHISRLFILIIGIATFVVLICQRLLYQKILKTIRLKGYNTRNVLIVGSGPRARHFTNLILNHAEWGLRVVGYVDDNPREEDTRILGRLIIGTTRDIPDLVKENIVDEVIIAIPRRFLNEMEEVVQICEETGIETTVLADLFDTFIANAHLSFIDDTPLLTFSTVPAQEWKLLIKAVIDFIGAAFLIFGLAPLLLTIAILVKLTSRGPILYRQRRIGLHGREFMLYKFRSMYLDAEERQQELQHLNEMTGPVFKIAKDPRVTKIGRFIRKTSLDELPQLLNVINGDMSLVGPRPPIPHEVVQYKRWQHRRLSMKPGITCIWQVNGRNKIGFEDWMKLDLQYIDNWSLGLDFKILFKTIPVVLFGYGAS
jgi:exopolysaccharide biosynthesis polyprenyl glycosylphosphotransferase